MTDGLLLAVVVTTASLQDRDGAFRITAAGSWNALSPG
jgi:hypothetical protein